MLENKKYTIIVKSSRIEVNEAVYRAYHKEREAEKFKRLSCVESTVLTGFTADKVHYVVCVI